MKFNHDCVRDILLEVESNGYGVFMSLDLLCSKLPQYSSEEISYCLLKMREGNLIDVRTANAMNVAMPLIVKIRDITYDGHEFLDNVRLPSTWDKVKETATSVGAFSIDAMKAIAVNVVTNLINGHFLP